MRRFYFTLVDEWDSSVNFTWTQIKLDAIFSYQKK